LRSDGWDGCRVWFGGWRPAKRRQRCRRFGEDGAVSGEAAGCGADLDLVDEPKGEGAPDGCC